MIITIDPGHGGHDPGAKGSRCLEKDLALRIALDLGARLILEDHEVYYTRCKDEYIGLNERAHIANEANSDLFVSIHCNGSNNPQAQGIEVWCYNDSKEGREYAKRVQDVLVTSFLHHKDRGVKEGNFAVLRETRMPAILVECEFITNPQMETFIEEHRKDISMAIMQGIT